MNPTVNPLVIIAVDIAWVVWVTVLVRLLRQPRVADLYATFIGLAVVVVAVWP